MEYGVWSRIRVSYRCSMVGRLERRWRACSVYGVEQRKKRKRQKCVTTAPESANCIGKQNESSKKKDMRHPRAISTKIQNQHPAPQTARD